MAKRKAVPKRKRRKHSEEFKREAVKLVSDQQISVAAAARNLGINPSLLRNWIRRFESENEDASLTEDERMEMARLRAENRRLRMERDILPLEMSIPRFHILTLLCC